MNVFPLDTSPFTAIQLLSVLPLGAAVVVFSRAIGGVSTFGLFVPVLLAIAFVQTGFLAGPLIFAGSVIVGLVSAPLLRRLNLPRVALVAGFMSVVTLTLMAVHEFGSFEGAAWATAFPVIVTAVVVERLWFMWEENGLREAFRTAFWTFLIAFGVQLLVLTPVVRALMDLSPFLVASIGLVLVLILGRYRGLRLNEVSRFREVLDAERRDPGSSNA